MEDQHVPDKPSTCPLPRRLSTSSCCDRQFSFISPNSTSHRRRTGHRSDPTLPVEVFQSNERVEERHTSQTPNSLTNKLSGNLDESIWEIKNTFDVKALSNMIGILLV